MAEGEPSRLQYLRNRILSSREAFERFGSDTGQVISRGLTHSIGTEQTYENILPRFQGKTIVEVLADKTETAQQKANQLGVPPERVKYLDIGYGNGFALLEASENELIIPIGYGNSHLTEVEYKDLDGTVHPPTQSELNVRRVQLIEGNVLDIGHNITGNSIDVISMEQVMHYTDLPYWEIIKRIYRLLKPGGVAFIDNTYFSNREELSSFLTAQGYSFEIGFDNISFQKTKPTLDVPIRTKTGETGEFQTVEILRE